MPVYYILWYVSMYATSLKKLKKVLAFDEKLCYDYQHTAGNAVIHKENLTKRKNILKKKLDKAKMRCYL